MDVCCAVDLGTSGAKVLLVTGQGEVVATASAPYRVAAPHPGWAETDPREWAEAVRGAIAEALAAVPGSRVVAVGLDGQMHGLVLAAGTGPVRPAVLWPDGRAGEQARAWSALPAELLDRLANPVVPGMFGPILEWLATHEPDAVAAAEVALSPKDWLRGAVLAPGSPSVTDPSDASATLLWDSPAGAWHDDLVAARGLPARLLPPVRPASDPVGVTDRAAGLPAGVPVAVGSADTAATLAGLDLAEDEVLVNLGTGIQVCQTGGATGPVPVPTCHTYADALGGRYSMVAPQNGGLALQRVVELLGASWSELYGTLDLPDAGGVGFAPFLAPDRLPRLRPGDAASWTGIGLGTTRAHLLRAALESVAFQVDRAVRALPRAPGRIRFAGGGVRDARMRQLLSDVTGLPGRTSAVADATGLGAARIGWLAAGVAPTWGPAVAPGDVEPRRDDGLAERSAAFRADAAGGQQLDL